MRRLTKMDWLEALKLTAIGNILYYICLTSAIQMAGESLSIIIIGTLPVAITISSNLINHRDGYFSWGKLAPGIAVVLMGIACVNHVELATLSKSIGVPLYAYSTGAGLAVVAVICWTWYAIRNARWLRDHAGRNPRSWATVQGLISLPVTLLGYVILWLWNSVSNDSFVMPFGPRPEFFIGVMVITGLFASWLGILCWNEASQRLPTTLVGQLIIFETLAALAYAYLLQGKWPEPLTLIGVGLLIFGVCWIVRIKPDLTETNT